MSRPVQCDGCGTVIDLESDPSADWNHLFMCHECRHQSGGGSGDDDDDDEGPDHFENEDGIIF